MLRLCLHDEFQPGTHIKAIARLHDNPGWNLNPGLEAGLRFQAGLKKVENTCEQFNPGWKDSSCTLQDPFSTHYTDGRKTAFWILRAWFQPASCKHTSNLNPGWFQTCSHVNIASLYICLTYATPARRRSLAKCTVASHWNEWSHCHTELIFHRNILLRSELSSRSLVPLQKTYAIGLSESCTAARRIRKNGVETGAWSLPFSYGFASLNNVWPTTYTCI